MSLREQLTNDLKSAMKSGNVIQKDTIRALRGAIRNVEIDTGQELNDAEILSVINKQAKQRRDSIEQYRQADRIDLVEQEEAELKIIEVYLPQQLSDEEITIKAKAVIAELGVTDMKGMGTVMQRLTGNLKDVADGKRISIIVRTLLK